MNYILKTWMFKFKFKFIYINKFTYTINILNDANYLLNKFAIYPTPAPPPTPTPVAIIAGPIP